MKNLGIIGLVLIALTVDAAGTKITVDATKPGREITDYMFGVNHRYAQCGYGMFDPQTMQVRPDFLEKSRHCPGAVRWPGGTIANLVNWKETIGPVAQRKSQRLGNLQRTEDFPYYGIDEHMRYCEQIGAKCVIMMPFAPQMAADAADFVEYLNAPNDGKNPNGGVDWAAVRAKNGHPRPYGIKYFEIGNEMFDPHQRYWMNSPSFKGPDKHYTEKYANGDTVKGKDGKPEKHDGFCDFARAMKAVDPSILVFSCLDEIWEKAKDPSVCDGVVRHSYRPFGKCETPRDVYDTWIRRGDGMARTIPENLEKVRAKAPRAGTHVIVTEFGIIDVPAVWTDKDDNLARDEGRVLARALHFATILIGCIKADVELMMHQGYTAYGHGGGQNLGSAGRVYNAMFSPDPKHPDQFLVSPTALAYELFEPFRGGRLIAADIVGNPQFGARKKQERFEAFRTLACRTPDGKTALMVVNRDPDQAASAEISLAGVKAGAGVRRVLTGARWDSCNTPEHPKDVKIVTSALAAPTGATFTETFAPHSITVLVF